MVMVYVYVRPYSHTISLAALFVRNVKDHTDRAVLQVGPIIEERIQAMREWGSEWNDKPVCTCD